MKKNHQRNELKTYNVTSNKNITLALADRDENFEGESEVSALK